ncbi:MAG: T9SS type A sorting domain-containing protein [Crocinitomicaceae bacterium]|nr:T9SS type A sorting domain-containing protein [Crocinitomicaceae bacterium]
MKINLVSTSRWRRMLGISIAVGLFSNISLGANITSTPALNGSVKGDFESPSLNGASYAYDYDFTHPNGFTFSAGTGISSNGSGFTSANPNAPNGSQVAFIQGSGAYIERTFGFGSNSGRFYRVVFKSALRNRPGEKKRLRVLVDNIEVGEFDIISSNYKVKTTLPIFLNSGQHTIRIVGVNTVSAGNHTAFIDELRLQRVRGWNEPSSWVGGVVPGPNDHAIISSNSVIALGGTMSVNSIKVMGELCVAQNRNLYLASKYIMVMGASARFDIGQKLAPYTMDATITLNADLSHNSSEDETISWPGMGTNFVGAMNSGRIELHGEPKTSWQRIQANVSAGGTTIDIPVTNWEVGDKIVIAPSRSNWLEAEERTITGITNLPGANKRLTLNAPLSYPHTGVIKTYSNGSNSWTADLRAEVGMLTHNIKIQGDANSESDDGFGGHMMIMMDGKAHVSHVELFRMGQKSILGRYPFHWHLLANGGNGQYIENSSVHKSFNRAITIHGTHKTRVDRNVCYDHIGHGVFLEDGSEENNLIRANFVLHTKRPVDGEELIETDNEFNQAQNRSPASFWITNPKNKFHANVAAGTPGTGFWFAFPKKPIGASATDSRFSSIEPYKNPLLLFKDNKCHSSGTGIDVFDQISGTDKLIGNGGWLHNGIHLIENSLFYANKMAIYTGTGNGQAPGAITDNLIFKNNVLVENEVGAMIASYAILESCVVVADSEEGLLPSNKSRRAWRVYDGPGRVENSYFVGWNTHPKANFLMNTGAGVKHTNNWFVGNTTDDGIPRMVLPNYDRPPKYEVGANALEHPRLWSLVLRDEDGGIGGKANTSIVSNHPFLLTGNEYQHSNWTRVYRSDHKFVLSLMRYLGHKDNYPNVTVTRSGNGASEESVFYIGGDENSYKEHHQLPCIANEDFLYTYNYESLPSQKQVLMRMDDAEVGDYYMVCIKNFGKLQGLNIQSSQGIITGQNSLSNLKNAGSSGYLFLNGDLYIRAVATDRKQGFTITWTGIGTYPSKVPDTDGDYMADGLELELGRNPFDASDLAFEFNSYGDFEGWAVSKITSENVSANSINGYGTGDAKLINSDFNFDATEVGTITVRMKSSHNKSVQLFFATSSSPTFAGKVVTAQYTGDGNWQELTFNMSGNASWTGTITKLRLDPTTVNGQSFNIDWIRANNAIQKSLLLAIDSVESEENDLQIVKLFPNPVIDILMFEGLEMDMDYQIVDKLGRVLQKGLTNNFSIQVSNLKEGMYWIHINGETHSFLKKE